MLTNTIALSLSGTHKCTKRCRIYVVCDYSPVVLQVEGRLVSAIGPGLLVLVGLHETDADSDAEYMYVLSKRLIFLFLVGVNLLF